MRTPSMHQIVPHPALKKGALVQVRKDDGSLVYSRCLSDPWQLGHGAWVIKLEGFSGGYAIERVYPRQEAK